MIVQNHIIADQLDQVRVYAQNQGIHLLFLLFLYYDFFFNCIGLYKKIVVHLKYLLHLLILAHVLLLVFGYTYYYSYGFPSVRNT